MTESLGSSRTCSRCHEETRHVLGGERARACAAPLLPCARMKFFLAALPVLALFFASCAAHAAAPVADDSARAAKDLVKEGREEYSRQHWEAARIAFLKAWNINPHYAIAGSLADVELKLGRYREAAAYLRYALANLPPERAEKRSEAEARLKECRVHLSAVRVLPSVAEATVRLDGSEVPAEALGEELLIEPGRHRLEAEKSGFVGASHQFTSAAGEAREIKLELTPQPAPSSAPPVHDIRAESSDSAAGARPASNSSPSTWILVGGGAATVVALGIGTYFAVRESSYRGDVNELLSLANAQGSPAAAAANGVCRDDAPMRPAETCESLQQANDSRVHAARAANAAFITAGALAVATVVTYLIWPARHGEPSALHARVTVAPSFVGIRGAVLNMAF